MTSPARPGSISPADVLDASRKVHSIGADLAASVIRRCSTKQEALDCLMDARNQVCSWHAQVLNEGKPSGKGKFNG